MKRRWLALGGALLVVSSAGGAATIFNTEGGSPTAEASTSGGATAKVRRGDLVESTSSSGSIEHADGRQLASGLSGVLTWLPRSGKVIKEGKSLYRVGDQPVVRFDGTEPAWRDLSPDVSDGRDVRQLEVALMRLGYGDEYDMGADGDWTWATTQAVKDWQADRGLDESGTVRLGTVVFTDGDLRVDSRLLEEGATVGPGANVLEVSDVARRVAAALETTQRHLAPVGGTVTLAFPDGSRVRGRIADVTLVPAADEQSDDTLSVTVEPFGQRARRTFDEQLDGSSVQVTFTDTLAENVLIVPVTALVALGDGGYAVQVVDSGDTRLVGVEIDGFGDTTVAVNGGLEAGDSVVVTP